MIHDIDYLRYCGRPQAIYVADMKAISGADYFTWQGQLVKLGLAFKSRFMPSSFSEPLRGLSEQQTRSIGWDVFEYVKGNSEYQRTFKEFGVPII